MEEQPPQQERAPRERQSLPQRSFASNNWRMKDDTPRGGIQPKWQPRNGQAVEQNQRSTSNRNSASFSEPAAGTRLYVGNLLYSAQKDDISLFFTENGFNVVNLSMSIDPMTGRNPSYCFVDLDSVEEASRAMSELNGKEVLGRAVRINPGVAKKPTVESPGLRTKSNGRGWKEDGGQENYKPTFDRWSRSDAPSHWNNTQAQSKRLYVGNLPRMEPQSAVDAAMQQLFSGFELTAVSKIISPHQSKASEPGDHYYLFVDLANAEDVDAAIEALDGTKAEWGGNVKINRAKDNRDRKVNREQFGSDRKETRPQSGWRGQEDGQAE